MLDSNGAFVIEYKYDAWGRKLSVTGSLAATLGMRNPFRYRGYVYDEETGLYYNSTRYYNSSTFGMLSPDLYTTVTESQYTFANKNIYAYTENNPVNRLDADGLFWDTLLDIISVVSSVIDVIARPADSIAFISLAADVASLAVPVSVTWKRATNTADAFTDEYMQMQKYGLASGGISYNLIWLPGKKIYEVL